MLEALLAWDTRTFRLINEVWINPALDRSMPFVTDAGNYLIPCIVAALILAIGDRWRGLRFLLLGIAGVLIADAVATHIFKAMDLRPRPCAALEGVRLLVGCTHTASMPSNHATNASVLATLAGCYRRRLWFPAAVLASLIGYSRVYVGVHYPLDVLAGAALGVTVGVVLSAGMTSLWPYFLDLAQRRGMSYLKNGTH